MQSRRSGYFHTRRIQGEEPEGARRPAGNRRSQDILFWGPDFGQISQFLLAKSLRDSGRARSNDSILVSTPSNVEVAARKLRLQLALYAEYTYKCDRDVQGQTCRNMTVYIAGGGGVPVRLAGLILRFLHRPIPALVMGKHVRVAPVSKRRWNT